MLAQIHEKRLKVKRLLLDRAFFSSETSLFPFPENHHETSCLT